MRINNNIMSLNAHRQLGANQQAGAKSMERLSSGLRINRAGDDAAGLAISEKMRGQIRGLNQASRNSQDAISLIQTAEGALNETHSILQRMRELATQAANSTNADIDRSEIQNEINQLTSEINRIGNTTEFNTKNLLNGEIGISGDGRAVEAGATYGTGMSDLAVDTNSALAVGNYRIDVTSEINNQISGGQSSDAALSGADTSVTQAVTSLSEGSYKVAITEETGKAIDGAVTDAANLVSGDISVAKDSTLANVAHTITVSMNTNVEATGIDVGGISDVDGSGAAAGQYTLHTSVVLDDTNIADGGAGQILTEGAISNLAIAEDSSLQHTDAYTITTSQLGSAGALVTADTALSGATDLGTLADLVLNTVAVDLSTVEALGDGFDLDVAGNRESVRAALQTDINAVFNGTAHDGATFTVGLDGDKLTIQNNDRALGEEATMGAAIAELGIGGTESATTTYDTTDNVEMRFELREGGDVVQSASATFTATSGSTNIKLGDISFDVDGGAVYASDADATLAGSKSGFDGNTITFGTGAGTESIKYQIVVEQDGADAQTVLVEQGADTTETATFTDGSDFVFDVTGSEFVGGNTYNSYVTSTDEYTVQLSDTGGDVGDAYTFTGSASVADLKHINLGGAGTGLFVSLDRDEVFSIANGDSETIEFTIAEDTNFYAQALNADGTVIADSGQFALDSNAAADTEIGLGNGIEFVYTGTGDVLAEGNHYFSVQAGVETFEMTLTDTDSNTQLGAAESFSKGETVTFGSTGLSITTDSSLVAGENTVFGIEDTTIDNSLAMQIGANQGQSMNIDVQDMRANAIKVSGEVASTTVEAKSGAVATFAEVKAVTDGTTNESAEYALDVSTHENASAAIDVINDAIETVSAERSKLGSFQNRLEHTISNLGTSSENLQAAESRIRDLDMAQEMMSFTKNNILSQAATAMLAQANMAPQSVLQLLG